MCSLLFCGEYWVGCLVFFYQTSGCGLYLQLTDGVSFFGFVYFCISVGWVFAVDKIAVGALLFCYKNYT